MSLNKNQRALFGLSITLILRGDFPTKPISYLASRRRRAPYPKPAGSVFAAPPPEAAPKKPRARDARRNRGKTPRRMASCPSGLPDRPATVIKINANHRGGFLNGDAHHADPVRVPLKITVSLQRG